MAKQSGADRLDGLHPIRRALETGKRTCQKLVMEEDCHNPRIQQILELAQEKGIRIETLHRDTFRKKYGTTGHQSLVGYFSPLPPSHLEDLIESAQAATDQPILALLGEIQDPQNLGAILRSAEAMGLQGAVIPKHRSAPLNHTVAKCAAGALESLTVATVGNLGQAVRTLKENGYWVVGCDMEGESDCTEFEFTFPLALIVGGEGQGMRPLLKKNCDMLVRIPMPGEVESLNASVAAGVMFYEAVRQRSRMAGK